MRFKINEVNSMGPGPGMKIFPFPETGVLANALAVPFSFVGNVLENNFENEYVKTIAKVIKVVPLAMIAAGIVFLPLSFQTERLGYDAGYEILFGLCIGFSLIPIFNKAMEKIAKQNGWQNFGKFIKACDKLYRVAAQITNLVVNCVGLWSMAEMLLACSEITFSISIGLFSHAGLAFFTFITVYNIYLTLIPLLEKVTNTKTPTIGNVLKSLCKKITLFQKLSDYKKKTFDQKLIEFNPNPDIGARGLKDVDYIVVPVVLQEVQNVSKKH